MSDASLRTSLVHMQTSAVMAMFASEYLLPSPVLNFFRQRQEATSFRRLGKELARNGGSSPLDFIEIKTALVLVPDCTLLT